MPRINVKDKRRQQLIDATMTSIAKRGLTDTTVTHICDAARMSRGVVNFYFTSKEKMMQETLAHLVSEFNACWQDALAQARGVSAEPLMQLRAVWRVLMGEKLSTVRRLAVWNAFLAHAGTHAGYARVINASDDLLIRQLRALWQQSGLEAKDAERRARQMLAVLRGHQVLGFLNIEGGRLASFGEDWASLLFGEAGKESARPAPVQKQEVRAKQPPMPPVAKPKAKKEDPLHVLPGQLDFGELFAKP